MAGIYLHIPFCKTRCTYCDFYSTTQQDLSSTYIEALCKELKLRNEYLDNEVISSIYLGGGTPSQLDITELKAIFSTIADNYSFANEMEITLEANPDDLTPEYIEQLKCLPINRLSIGTQTFHDEMLQKLNRRHNSKQAIEAIAEAQKQGFNNISIDLMYGLPGETMKEWEEDLETAIQLNIQHISAYHLIYEEGTPLFRNLEKGLITEVDEELSLSFFKKLIEKLTHNGFIHYEISNFAKPNKLAQHNTSYWLGSKYLGCGPSAHSFNGESRDYNAALLSEYIKALNQDNLVVEKEILSQQSKYNDFIITRLRTMWGVSLTEIHEQFGKEFKEYTLRASEKHLKQENLVLINDRLKLTAKGIFLSDGIMSDLLIVS